MSERLIVSVDAPAGHPNVLRVEDAFEQILELFELAASSSDAEQPSFVWRLVSVSMNSPLTVVAEAVSLTPGVQVDAAARQQKRQFAENISSLRRGVFPSAWSQGARRNVAKRVFQRSGPSVGSTHVILDDTPGNIEQIDITPTPEVVQAIQEVIHKPDPIQPKAQIGSVEGYILHVATHYNHPALHIRERRTGRQIWCLVSEENQKKIADEANFNDVWTGRRIVASGRIEYDTSGEIAKVTATRIRLVAGKALDIEGLSDPDFTEGRPASEYLENFREGNLG